MRWQPMSLRDTTNAGHGGSAQLSAKCPFIVTLGAALAFEAPAFFESLARGVFASLAAGPLSPDFEGTVSLAAAPAADFEQLAPELGRGFKEGGAEELDAFSAVTLESRPLVAEELTPFFAVQVSRSFNRSSGLPGHS